MQIVENDGAVPKTGAALYVDGLLDSNIIESG